GKAPGMAQNIVRIPFANAAWLAMQPTESWPTETRMRDTGENAVGLVAQYREGVSRPSGKAAELACGVRRTIAPRPPARRPPPAGLSHRVAGRFDIAPVSATGVGGCACRDCRDQATDKK